MTKLWFMQSMKRSTFGNQISDTKYNQCQNESQYFPKTLHELKMPWEFDDEKSEKEIPNGRNKY